MTHTQNEVNALFRMIVDFIENDTCYLTRDDISNLTVRILETEKYVNDLYALRVCTREMQEEKKSETEKTEG